jgi:mono/diheme cytochrome c family protein
MTAIKQLVLAWCLFCGQGTLAQAEITPNEQRGELLYSTHCIACHNSTIHWREQRLVTDWKSLKAQVNRWQSYTKLGWREQDIVDVALYLNIHYYNFMSPEQKLLSQAKQPEQARPKY